MKNKIYRKLKQVFIVLSISISLLSGPVAGNEISKMFEHIRQRDALIVELNEAENEEEYGEKLKRKNR